MLNAVDAEHSRALGLGRLLVRAGWVKDPGDGNRHREQATGERRL